MYLAPLNYDRFFRRVFSHVHIAKAFLEDFLEVEIEEIELLETAHFLTNDAARVEFDFRCKIAGNEVIIDMQQWYKPDVIKRFYLYHCVSTALQLERLPEKRILISHEPRAKSKDYKYVNPVITLVWMVQDNFGLDLNYLTMRLSPEDVANFLRDKTLWENPDIQQLISKRNEMLKLLQNTKKDMNFLAQNQLTFMFQSNIVKDTKFAKYHDWFIFAEKTRNQDNTEDDFRGFEQTEPFKEIIYLINKQKLTKEDLNYIETEEENAELIERALKDEFDNGVEVGRIEGKIEGYQEKEEEFVLRSHEAGLSIQMIAQIIQITENEIIDILKKHNKI